MNPSLNGPDKNPYCGAANPKMENVTCVKLPGHGPDHAACLGVHPATEYEPEMAEWVEWFEPGTEPYVEFRAKEVYGS